MVDHARAAGFSIGRIGRILQLRPERVWRWQLRAVDGQLEDRRPGRAVHGVVPAEVDAIVEIAQTWRDIDRSHRKLAHRGSRQDRVWVSPSTFRRVLADQQVDLPEPPPPAPKARISLTLPVGLDWKPNNIWIYDGSEFARASREVVLVMDVVSRKWLSTVVSPEWTSTQVELAFTRALEAEGLDEVIAARIDDPNLVDPPPVLLVWSDIHTEWVPAPGRHR